MAVTLPAQGTGTTEPVIATDTISAEEYQLIKLGFGAAGAFTLAASGTGTDSAGVQRVSLATNVALPAGTNAIGKLAANSGVDIGDVDILSIAAGDNNIGNVDIASIAAGDNNIGNVDIVSGTITTVTSLTQMNGAAISMGTGTRDASTQRVTIATDDVVPASQSGTWNIGTVTAVTAISNALPAGTNAIGKLAANSGVDIGDVDVTSLPALPAGTNNIGDVDVLTVPRSMMGPGQPGTAIDSHTHASFNLAAGADQVLVSSAASKQIWVYGIGFTVNVAGTVSFQDEDNTAITGVMQMGATGGMTISPSGNFSMPIWKLGTDKDLEVDVVTSELDGWLCYAIVSV